MPTAAMANILVFSVAVALLCFSVISSWLVWQGPYRERTHALLEQAHQVRELRIAIIVTGEKLMSKTAELSQAVTDLAAAANAAATAIQNGGVNTTPDADVATAVTSIQSISSQLNAVAGGTPNPAP